MVDSCNWGSENSRSQVKCSALVDTGQFKRDDDTGSAENVIPLNEEMDALRLNINGTNDFLGSCKILQTSNLYVAISCQLI